MDVFVTWSNAKFLSRDIVTEFAGRGDQIHMDPLNFSKFLSVYTGDKYEGMSEYMLYGGILMAVLREDPRDKAVILQNLFDDCFKDSFFVESAQRYDIKGRAYIETPKKYYFTDPGLRNARLHFRQYEPTHLIENVIYNELRMRGYQVDVGTVYSTEKDKNGKTTPRQLEVDFVCNLFQMSNADFQLFRQIFLCHFLLLSDPPLMCRWHAEYKNFRCRK